MAACGYPGSTSQGQVPQSGPGSTCRYDAHRLHPGEAFRLRSRCGERMRWHRSHGKNGQQSNLSIRIYFSSKLIVNY